VDAGGRVPRGRLIAERGVGPVPVILPLPVTSDDAGLGQLPEDVDVQTFVARSGARWPTLQMATSTTSTAYPSGPAARQSIDQCAQATERSAQAEALHRTNPTSTSHQPALGLHRYRSMRTRAPRQGRHWPQSPSVSSRTPLPASCPADTKRGGSPHLAKNGKALTTIFRYAYRPTGRFR
jgi:hypothetical protein